MVHLLSVLNKRGKGVQVSGTGNVNIAQKMKFFMKDLVTLTEEILNGKLHFLCSVTPRIGWLE